MKHPVELPLNKYTFTGALLRNRLYLNNFANLTWTDTLKIVHNSLGNKE